jgi:hypothetical protein
LSDLVGRAFVALEGEGVAPRDFLKAIVDNPTARRAMIRLAISPEMLEMPHRVSHEAVVRLVLQTLGRQDVSQLTEAEQKTCRLLADNGGLQGLTRNIAPRHVTALVLYFGLTPDGRRHSYAEIGAHLLSNQGSGRRAFAIGMRDLRIALKHRLRDERLMANGARPRSTP